jgi:hypothetical protein
MARRLEFLNVADSGDSELLHALSIKCILHFNRLIHHLSTPILATIDFLATGSVTVTCLNENSLSIAAGLSHLPHMDILRCRVSHPGHSSQTTLK